MTSRWPGPTTGSTGPGPPPEWRQKRETARWGALSDVGTHHIDLLRMLLGEISEATGYFERQPAFETDDAAAAALRDRSRARPRR